MLIVASSITTTIREVTEFLRNVYGMKIFCLEFDYYRDRASEFFVPKLIGDEKMREVVTSPERMTRGRLLDEIEGPQIRDHMIELLNLAHELGLKEERMGPWTVSFQYPAGGTLFRLGPRYYDESAPHAVIVFKDLLEVDSIRRSQEALRSHEDHLGGDVDLRIAVTPNSIKEITQAIQAIFDHRSKAEKST